MVNDLDTLILFACCSYSDLLAVVVSKWNINHHVRKRVILFELCILLSIVYLFHWSETGTIPSWEDDNIYIDMFIIHWSLLVSFDHNPLVTFSVICS